MPMPGCEVRVGGESGAGEIRETSGETDWSTGQAAAGSALDVIEKE
jgi:hypothetical protein